MSDAGGSRSLNNVQLTFDQTAPELPNEGQIVSGIYKPSNFPGNPALDLNGYDLFVPPAPLQFTYLNNLDTLNGLSPNGSWRLFIVDDEHLNAGSLIAGWALEITTDGAGSNWISVTSGSSGVGGGTVNYLVSQNIGNLPRAGTIMIRGRAYTVRQDGAFNLPSRAAFDFDGDRKADISVFRPSNGTWYISNSSNNSLSVIQFGADGDLLAPADYDGDGKTDICVFRPTGGEWYRLNSSNNTFSAFQFGANGDLPAPGDFDGDRKADLVVFRLSTGTWYLLRTTSGFTGFQFGAAGDIPTPNAFVR